MSEYDQWLLVGDVEAGLQLLRRIAAQAVRTGPFPPPQGYDRWSDDAVDELLVEMIAKKGSTAFLLDALASVDNQGSAERYLLATVQNFQKDQAKATEHGKLRERLKNVLGKDSRFMFVTSPHDGWRLVDGPAEWWQGDIADLHRTALRVRGVSIPSWNTAGPTARPAQHALATVAVAVLTDANGTVRAEDLAQILLERFRHEIAPETVGELFLADGDEQIGRTDQELEHALTGISAEELWARLTSEQRAIVPYLITPGDAAAQLGIGPKEAAARRAQVIELVRLATVDDPRADEVVMALLDIASLPARPAGEMARQSLEEPADTEGRMSS
ncbi:hypothetical protein JKP75_13290 [Blastococcus sp. TML/M2B]|uniref:hypothetical protein n=1 Tax=unclassified Blastococcus TaxID=2619396 RepID=UPI00190B4D87|nr:MULTISPECIES: hypothetical protein [unclassified Blastococcus]MBN1093452.1 hypothetical protein [Blastococcus sp. TML/M2B]MBN1096432.1 hypothetical protein [Blastococcus sp. TML/C7B]